MECPFHGKSPEEEKKRRRPDPDVGEPDEELEVRGPNRSVAPARDRTGPRPAPFVSQDELVPVSVRVPDVARAPVAVFQEEAFPDVGIPLLPPAIGTPIYIPDESIPESLLPPGVRPDFVAEIGVAGEEAFAGMVASAEVSTALQTAEIGQFGAAVEKFEGGNPAYTELGWLFSALWAANAVAHLWQTYNASVAGSKVKTGPVSGPKLSPVQTSVRVQGSPQKVLPPQALPVPKAAPPRIPVSASGGGGIGFMFQSNPGSVEPPLPQAEFDRVFQRTLDFAPIPGGGQDTD